MVEVLYALEGGGEGSSPALASAIESFEITTAAGGSRIIDGRFEIGGRIGTGATGSVYRAFDRTLDRHVAIKVLEPNQPHAAREAQILARVRHRNVVAIHDYGVAPEFRYLVLELLVGRDLRQWLTEQPSSQEILARFLEAGRGLAAAHAAGLVHRDFKPSNLIVTYDETGPAANDSLAHGRMGRAVVIDFSLARNVDTLEEAPPVRPSPRSVRASHALAYLAPERLVLDAGDARCDQFAFCVMLWEALTGEHPFTGDDANSRRESIARGPGPFEADVPSHIGRALRRGLSLSPTARFPSMGELLEAIEAPTTSRKRRRRPLLTAVLVVATFALGWGVAPDPVIEEAVSDEAFDAKASAAFILFDSANEELAAGNTIAAKDDFDAATKLILEVEKASPAYCRFGAAIEAFADGLLHAGDLPRGRVLYTRAHKFASDCGRPLDYIEHLEAKKRSSREAFLSTKHKTHTPEQTLAPPPNQSYESGESFQWTDSENPSPTTPP